MKIQALEYFVVLSETKSINEASKKLYISQPSLTKSLQLMEEELGVTLCIRSTSGIELTDAGNKMLPEAKQVVAYYHNWLKLAKNHDTLRVDICSHISLAGFLLPDIVLKFRQHYPALHVNCLSDSNPEQYLLNHLTKPVLAICICSSDNYRRLSRVLGSAPLILADGYYGCLVSKSSPLAKKTSVTFDDLKSYYLALPSSILTDNSNSSVPKASFMSDFLPKMIETISYNQILQVEAVSSVITLAEDRSDVYAISFSPAHYRYKGVASGNLIDVPINHPSTKGKLCLVYSKQICQQYPILQELANEISSDCRSFIASHTHS